MTAQARFLRRRCLAEFMSFRNPNNYRPPPRDSRASKPLNPLRMFRKRNKKATAVTDSTPTRMVRWFNGAAMARRLLAAAALLALLLTSTLMLAPYRPARAQVADTSVPDEIVYRHYFHHIAFLKKRADDAQAKGRDRSSLRQIVRTQAGLTEYEGQVLESIALLSEAEIAAQDARAKVIIDRYRAQFPLGAIPHDTTLPPRPPELAQMWRERNAMILLARDRLHGALGDAAFAKFDTYVKAQAAAEAAR